MTRIFIAAVVAVVAVAVPARAQSLGELAQKEADRRKAMGAPAKPAPKKVFTKDDIKETPPPPATQAAQGDAAKPKDEAKAKEDAAKPAPDDKGEEYWRARMGNAREELRRNEIFREALQTRINSLTADYSSRDDPAQRARIGDDRQKALAEFDRVTKAIEDGKKQIADIEEEARRANVPPGWIR
jgi:hypothetical protein